MVGPGATVPPAWADAAWVHLDAAALAQPDPLCDVLAGRLAARQRTVIELAVPFPQAGSPETEAETQALWRLGPRFGFSLERLIHLVWANSVDGTEPGALRWRWADLALANGATAGGAADVQLRDGTPAWCDGGPLGSLDTEYPVLHRIALERGRLSPLSDHPCSADLAPDQLAAVSHPGGAARIIAPAGSGKTRVLTERARHLLHGRGIPADAVTLVAFNKRAADEMVERTTDLSGLQIRTLNALGLALVDGRPPFARRDQRLTVIDEREVRQLLDGLVDFPRRKANTDPTAPWLDALSLARLGLRDPDEVEASFGGEVDGFADVLGRYRALLAERHLVDFDEQIVRAIEVLLAEPATRAAAQRSCRLLLVDEFQDLTPAHLLLVRLLAGPDGALFGVGDDDQTIYGYTGATPRWLIDYAELFPGAGDHPLEVNYRCPPRVVGAADLLLQRNKARVTKTIRSAPGRADDSDALEIVSTGDTLSATVAAVGRALAEGRSPGEIAVLARVNASLAPVQVGLLHAGLPVRLAVTAGWLERTGVRAALAWLRIATSPEQLRARDVAETVRRPSRGLSAKVVEWMGEQRSVEGLERLASRLRDRDADKVQGYAADVVALVALAKAGADTGSLLRHVRDRIGLDDAMDVLDSYQRAVKGSAQGDDLDALVALAALHPKPDGFAGWLTEQLSRPGDPDGVLLSSVHAVKGREWPEVVVHEATAGLFPHRLAEDVEEERRVFHVAITRCSRRVTVVAGADPSPFVAELTTAPSAADGATAARAPRVRPGEKSGRAGKTRPAEGAAADVDPTLREALRVWRSERASRDRVPAYVVFHDSTLDELARQKPATLRAMSAISGIGPTKLERYGDEVLAIVANG